MHSLVLLFLAISTMTSFLGLPNGPIETNAEGLLDTSTSDALFRPAVAEADPGPQDLPPVSKEDDHNLPAIWSQPKPTFSFQELDQSQNLRLLRCIRVKKSDRGLERLRYAGSS